MESRPPLQSCELILIAITAVHLCFLPWALGTMHVWSQLTSLTFASAGFLIALAARCQSRAPNKISEASIGPLRALIRLPGVWAALALLAYVAVQALNPAWNFQSTAETWWLEPRNHITWLPSSVAAPFARSNSWRMLVVLTSLALVLVSVWIGFSRRKSYHALFAIVAGNAALLGLYGIGQRISNVRRMFGTYVPSNESFAASFIYPNHAGAYFYLTVSLATGLAWWHYQRFTRDQEGLGPAMTFTFFAMCASAMVVLSYSRLSLGLLLAGLLVLAASAGLRMFRGPGVERSRRGWAPAIFALSAVSIIGILAWENDVARARLSALTDKANAELEARSQARRAAVEMFQDKYLFGWGAGCFRYGFSKYTKPYPAIHFWADGSRKTWEHAHSDLLEFPVELGIVGLTPIAALAGLVLWQLGRRRCWHNVLALSLIAGCSLVVVHAWFEFVFQNPAILITWGVLLASAIRWSELDQPGGRHAIVE